MIPAVAPAITATWAATSSFNTIKDVGKKLHTASASVAKGLHGLAAQGSYSDVAKMSRAEFLTLIDDDCLSADFMPEVTQSVLSISCAYYMQALSVLGNINSVRIKNVLNRLNPNGRDNSWFSMENQAIDVKNTNDGRWKMTLESYKWKLPVTTENTVNEIKYALEAMDATDTKGSGDKIKEAASLAVGKFVDIKIGTADGEVTMPISFRLNTKVVPSKDLVKILSQGKQDNTFVERYHAWKAGDIEFIKDFLLCSDMIKERKKLMLQDKSGAMSALLKRTNTVHRAVGLLGRSPDLGAATATFIMSGATAKELEKTLVGSLEDYKTRQRIFEAGHMLLLVVVDKQFEEITYYHRGIAESSTMRLRDIKISNKDSGPSLTDIMAALMSGRAPSF